MELCLSSQLRIVGSACVAIIVSTVFTSNLAPAAAAAAVHGSDGMHFRMRLVHVHGEDHAEQYHVPGGINGGAVLQEPLLDLSVPPPRPRSAAHDIHEYSGDGAADKLVGHAAGVYFTRARPPPAGLRLGLLYFTASFYASSHDPRTAASQLTLMGSLAAPSPCSSSSSSRAALASAAYTDPLHTSAESEQLYSGALAVVGGTGAFALARGEACVHASYRHHNYTRPTTTLSFHLHLISQLSAVPQDEPRMPVYV